jgi:hypothetical protein
MDRIIEQMIIKLIKCWHHIIVENACKASFIVKGEYLLREFIEPQDVIFEHQLQKFIQPDAQVAVLSGFPFFTVEYFGRDFYRALCEG